MNLLSKLSGNSTFPRDCLFSSSSLVRASLKNRRWYECALLSSISFASIICCRRLCRRSVLQRRLGSGVECTRSRLNLWISEDVTFCSFGCFFFFPLLSLLEVDLALSILAASLLFAKWSSNRYNKRQSICTVQNGMICMSSNDIYCNKALCNKCGVDC